MLVFVVLLVLVVVVVINVDVIVVGVAVGVLCRCRRLLSLSLLSLLYCYQVCTYVCIDCCIVAAGGIQICSDDIPTHNCSPRGLCVNSFSTSRYSYFGRSVIHSYHHVCIQRKVASAARAKAERNRPPEIEERVRMGVSGAALASDVFAPEPGKPCPLLGRWLKVAFADV